MWFILISKYTLLKGNRDIEIEKEKKMDTAVLSVWDFVCFTIPYIYTEYNFYTLTITK